MKTSLPVIPVVDLREGGPARHARESRAEARALRDACLGFFPRATLPFIPALDWAARRWLSHSRSPYLAEIASIAAALEFSGVWLLNASYQWGCTSYAFERDDEPWLVRSLDWPFSGLGRHVVVAQLCGSAGTYYSVTWPGYVGALTAMAPQRFAACVNQAPMWRRSLHRLLRGYDFAANALRTMVQSDRMPPDQLLRHVFETCADYAAARRMLETVPVARAVIYTLIGCKPGERCVIERTETGFLTREHDTSAANDWVPNRPHWEGRIGMRRFFSNSFADAAAYSRRRREALAGWRGALTDGAFEWVCEPVLNPYTRLAVVMNPARGELRAAGYERNGAPLPEPVVRLAGLARAVSAAPA